MVAEPPIVNVDEVLEEIRTKRHSGESTTNRLELIERVREYEKSLLVPPAQLAPMRGDDMERLALLDGLTELFNFKSFLKELKAEINRAKRYKQHCSVCMVAVDNFDMIVQQFGFLTGESVLRVVANVLRTALREVDIPARYGQQVFSIVLPQTAPASAALVAERVRQRIGNQAITLNWQNFSVTASVSVASFPTHAKAYDELIARALEVLEFAIERGGDRVLSI